ncbi:MAG: restriction endonuclease [Bacilli bacterium]|nr:restriction endonuclease [Bacilli bacterium]
METIELSKENQSYIKPVAFEHFLMALFKQLGYEVEYRKRVKDSYIDMELTYKKSHKKEKYICEIKFYSKLYFSPSSIVYSIMELSNVIKVGETGLLITNAICTPQCKQEALDKGIIILDIANLLYLIQPNNDLYQKFLELLDFSVAKISPKSPSIPFDFAGKIFEDENTKINWAQKFEDIKPGKSQFAKYEKVCVEALKLLFSDYLSVWEEQQKSNDDLYRFDLICKIKNDVNDDFFSTLNNYFNTRYIIFDFKNYKEQITQKEIYTTEKYLYDKALRKVAIIISRNGINKNALKAIKGSLREQGKVILTLTDYDILAMINMYYKGDNPTDYLSMKLDKLLIELEK